MSHFTNHSRSIAARDTTLLRDFGRGLGTGISTRVGRDWTKHQVVRDETFSLCILERYVSNDDIVGYTKQEDYVKVNFWLSGRHTTILEGFGEYAHHRPEVFITAGPSEMIKIDQLRHDTTVTSVALCMRRDFLRLHMGLEPDELPHPLCAIYARDDRAPTFFRLRLTAGIVSAARAILAAPFAVRSNPLYGTAKSVELMCLLINQMEANAKPQSMLRQAERRTSCLHDAKEFIMQRYAEAITLAQISKEVGLNRVALTSGFRELFGMSVYDFIQKTRMERALELLQDEANSVAQVGEAVGYSYQCNFSTAFHAYFGCAPQKIRTGTR